jgi:hypothetical protein
VLGEVHRWPSSASRLYLRFQSQQSQVATEHTPPPREHHSKMQT